MMISSKKFNFNSFDFIIREMNMNMAQMTKMFGLKDKKDVNMANNIWKMLDDMATSDPTQYQKFIEKNLKQGLEDAKHKK